MGHTRIFFPRTRLGPRPEFRHAVLINGDGTETMLLTEQKSLSKAALKVTFATETRIHPESLDADAKIRFVFDDNTNLECPFLINSTE